MCTRPADRPAAESAVTGLYRLLGEPAPQFRWVASPAAALPTVRSGNPGFGPPDLRAHNAPARAAEWPVAARLANSVSALRARLDRRIGDRRSPLRTDPGRTGFTLATAAAPDGLGAESGLPEILAAVVDGPLRATLRDGLMPAIRNALLPMTERIGPTWYGQHDAHWVARHDVHERVGLVSYGAEDSHELRLWAQLARSTGWWWSGDRVCVLSERPVEVHTEPLPGGQHGELRLHHPDAAAVRFADGAGVYVLHGTSVPQWVITDPTVARIHAEPNVEVRRAAIERIGWEAYIEQAGLNLVATAPDPANSTCELHLYDLPSRGWREPTARVLLVVNGSREPDGRRRRYGLNVPATIDDPVAAAGWSYGLTGEQYAQLARRT